MSEQTAADALRAEFEASYTEELVRRCGEGFRSTVEHKLSLKAPDGEYEGHPESIAFWSWKASRANLRIELPATGTLLTPGWNEAVYKCREVLEKKGLPVAP
ncbi:hypothetical protein [Pseudomonas sp. NPDC096950]|uniref:hypothetical protein n=1 Tax=Pseudomonas sp. NPDC096950 TaxID=3364485 RepID=UPI003839FC6D